MLDSSFRTVRRGLRLALAGLLLAPGVGRAENFQLNAVTLATESGATLATTNSAGGVDKFFQAQKELVHHILKGIGIPVNSLPPEVQKALNQHQTTNFAAFSAFSRGLDLVDRGQFAAAKQEFAQAVQLDPGFSLAASMESAMPEVNLKETPAGKAAGGATGKGSTGSGGTGNSGAGGGGSGAVGSGSAAANTGSADGASGEGSGDGSTATGGSGSEAVEVDNDEAAVTELVLANLDAGMGGGDSVLEQLTGTTPEGETGGELGELGAGGDDAGGGADSGEGTGTGGDTGGGDSDAGGGFTAGGGDSDFITEVPDTDDISDVIQEQNDTEPEPESPYLGLELVKTGDDYPVYLAFFLKREDSSVILNPYFTSEGLEKYNLITVEQAVGGGYLTFYNAGYGSGDDVGLIVAAQNGSTGEADRNVEGVALQPMELVKLYSTNAAGEPDLIADIGVFELEGELELDGETLGLAWDRTYTISPHSTASYDPGLEDLRQVTSDYLYQSQEEYLVQGGLYHQGDGYEEITSGSVSAAVNFSTMTLSDFQLGASSDSYQLKIDLSGTVGLTDDGTIDTGSFSFDGSNATAYLGYKDDSATLGEIDGVWVAGTVAGSLGEWVAGSFAAVDTDESAGEFAGWGIFAVGGGGASGTERASLAAAMGPSAAAPEFGVYGVERGRVPEMPEPRLVEREWYRPVEGRGLPPRGRGEL